MVQAYKATSLPFFVPVHDTWHGSSHVCACAYQQKENEQKGLEVEERRLGWGSVNTNALFCEVDAHHCIAGQEELRVNKVASIEPFDTIPRTPRSQTSRPYSTTLPKQPLLIRARVALGGFNAC